MYPYSQAAIVEQLRCQLSEAERAAKLGVARQTEREAGVKYDELIVVIDLVVFCQLSSL